MFPHVLKLDIGGVPVEWLRWEDAATLFAAKDLTRDHIVPSSRGGLDVYTNLATSCRACNARKDDRTPEEAKMPLLALPFEPDMASYLLLLASGRRITGCQQAFLEVFVDKRRRLS